MCPVIRLFISLLVWAVLPYETGLIRLRYRRSIIDSANNMRNGSKGCFERRI